MALISHMSESAAKIKPFFSPPLHETAVANTLRTTGAEDRALQGCNLSADSGAKTRLELTAKRGSSNLMDWDWHRRDKSQGSGDGVPRETFLPLPSTHFVIPLSHGFRSFVGYMSPPSTSA